MRSNWRKLEISNLFESADPRDFLEKALEHYYKGRGKPNLAHFSRLMGLSSRSHLSEFLAGRKRLSGSSVKLILQTLKLPREAASVFLYLCWRDYRCVSKNSEYEINETDFINSLKKSYLLNSAHKVKKTNSPLSTHLYRVYAALGSVKKGASENDIQYRTGLSTAIIRSVLEDLIKRGFIEIRTNTKTISSTDSDFKSQQRYHILTRNVDFSDLNSGDGFHKLIEQHLNEISKDAEKMTDQKETLLFYSAFSISATKISAFREKLKSTIYDLMDEFQDDNGDHVKQVFLSFK